MTIQEQIPRNDYVGNGVTTTYAFTFSIVDTSDVVVLLAGVVQTENSDYTIENVTELGGDVVFATPPGNLVSIVIRRDTPLSQDVDYTAYDAFPAETHEAALDKLTRITQELSTISQGGDPDRSLQLDPTNTFWDATSKQIKNVQSPVAPTDVATKAYADSLSQGFDPTIDRTITGEWTFSQTIVGTASGNLVSADLVNYTRNNQNESIVGNWNFSAGTVIRDLRSAIKKVGFRNPTLFDAGASRDITQFDEASIVTCGDINAVYTLTPLEKDTAIRFLVLTTGVTVVPGSGVSINLVDGSGSLVSAVNGVAIAQNSVVEVMYGSTTQVYLFGQGISVIT